MRRVLVWISAGVAAVGWVGAAHAQAEKAQPRTPVAAMDSWYDANFTCESGQNHDGVPVSEEEMKRACISLGVLTTRLTDAGYCLDREAFRWEPCE